MSTHPSFGGLPIVLGGNVFGYTADDDASFAILDRFYEAGGRMVDTAQGYSVWVDGHIGGESETVIGKWLASRGVRGDMLIATKTGMEGNAGDLAPAKVRQELEASLERLQTDYVDLYYAHRDDAHTALADAATGFGALVAEGQVRELGVSNYTAARLSALNDACDAAGTARFTVLQNEYNLVCRDEYDAQLQDYCTRNDVAHFPWYGLAAGFLTGKYRKASDLESGARGNSIKRFWDQGQSVLPALDAIANETGASHGAIALAWLIAHPAIAAPIASARTAPQLDLHFEAAALSLSDEQFARLDTA